MNSRGFSSEHQVPDTRHVEDAPLGFRAELADLLFSLGADSGLQEQHVYETIGRSLGVNVPGNPMGSRTSRAANVISQAEWPRVFDLVLRFVPEFGRAGRLQSFREAVNRLLAGYALLGISTRMGVLSGFCPARPSRWCKLRFKSSLWFIS